VRRGPPATNPKIAKESSQLLSKGAIGGKKLILFWLPLSQRQVSNSSASGPQSKSISLAAEASSKSEMVVRQASF
jgi:hypothetical protein